MPRCRSTTASFRTSRESVRRGRTVQEPRGNRRRARRERARAHFDDAKRGALGRRDPEPRAVEALEAEAGPFLHGRGRDLLKESAAFRDAPPAEDDEIGPEIFQPFERQQVGSKSGCDGAAVGEAVMAGARPRREADREDRVQAERDGAPHVVIEVAVREEVPRVPIVRREGEALGIRRRDERQEIVEVLRRRSLADPDVHAASDLLVRLGAREAFVVGAHAGPDVGVQIQAGEERRMPVDRDTAAARIFDLARDGGVPEEKARDVHHLGEPEDVRKVVERREVGGRERRPRRFEMRGRHARRQHHEDVHREARSGLEKGPDSRHAFHVRDLVRVRDRRRRAVCGRETRERRRRRHRGLDVKVRVPERGRDVRAPEVDLVVFPGGAVIAEAENPVAFHADGSVVDLAREDVYDAGVSEDEIGRDVAARRHDELGQGQRLGPLGRLHRMSDYARPAPPG